MSHHSSRKETPYEIGMRQTVEDLEKAKPPRRNSTPVLFAYIVTFGIFLPGLFMGIGNFIICPFAIPNGWSDPTDARGHCDQFGAQKAAVVYTCINIIYGIFIGYATKHLIQRMFRSIRQYCAKRKRIYEQGKQSEIDRIVKERTLAEKAKTEAKVREAEENVNELYRHRARLAVLEDAIDGPKASSSRRGQSTKSRTRSKHSAGIDSPDHPIMSGALPTKPEAHYSQAPTNSRSFAAPPVPTYPALDPQASQQDAGRHQYTAAQPGPQDRRGPQSQSSGGSQIGGPPARNFAARG